MVPINNQAVLDWIHEVTTMTQPGYIVRIDGGDTQLEELQAQAYVTGEMEKLNQEKLPGCCPHRTVANDVARVEDRIFICCRKQEDAGPVNNQMAPEETYVRLGRPYTGAMKGRTMYVIPYPMGMIGSLFARYGIELTDLIYVVFNIVIMTRAGLAAACQLGDDFVKGPHVIADSDPESHYIIHSPKDNTTMSVNSGYGDNVLLGRKCFVLRITSYLDRNQGWMAEHMLILDMENPQGEACYPAAASPFTYGRTNLAILIPPEHHRKMGRKVWCVGDDIAWLQVGPDGRPRAMNPEYGFFGVTPGTNEESNPDALQVTRRDIIFADVAYDLDNNTVWQEGLGKNPPGHAVDWENNPWDGKTSIEKGVYPNSWSIASARNRSRIPPELENPTGAPISISVFGGRRVKAAPLVYQSRNWEHGMFVGSIMASKTTAAAIGDMDVVHRDLMVMLPFCECYMADYWQHWLDMGKVLGDKAPKIFNIN